MKKAIILLVVLALSLSGCMMPQQPGVGDDEEPIELKIDSYMGEFYDLPKDPAADQVSVIYEVFYIIKGDFPLGLYIAEVENVGATTTHFTAEGVEIIDADDNPLTNIAHLSTKAPSILPPGEHGYVTAALRLEEMEEEDLAKISGARLDFEYKATDETLPDFSHLTVRELTLNQEQAALEGVLYNSSGEKQKRAFLVAYVKDKEGKLLVAETIEVKNIPADGEKKFATAILALDPKSEYEDIDIGYIFYGLS